MRPVKNFGKLLGADLSPDPSAHGPNEDNSVVLANWQIGGSPSLRFRSLGAHAGDGGDLCTDNRFCGHRGINDKG